MGGGGGGVQEEGQHSFYMIGCSNGGGGWFIWRTKLLQLGGEDNKTLFMTTFSKGESVKGGTDFVTKP